ncbi:MAG: peptidylprolyl isomerase [Acidimicrobiales bacterium]
MPTAKRERQRAARQAKKAKVQAVRKKRRYRNRGIVAVVVVIVGLGLVYLFNHGRAAPKTRVATKAPAAGKATTTTVHANTTGTGCPAASGSSPRRTSFTQPPPVCISSRASYTATITTDVGTITIALARDNPTTVNDFVFLARYHYYKGLTFHRVIPGFVVQGGDLNPPTQAHPSPGGPQTPGYTVKGAAPKSNAAYTTGTVAMAKTSASAPGTAGAQFFIVLSKKGAAELQPPDYSILGQVTSGMSVVRKIAADGGTGQAGYPKVTHKMLSVAISSH